MTLDLHADIKINQQDLSHSLGRQMGYRKIGGWLMEHFYLRGLHGQSRELQADQPNIGGGKVTEKDSERQNFERQGLVKHAWEIM